MHNKLLAKAKSGKINLQQIDKTFFLLLDDQLYWTVTAKPTVRLLKEENISTSAYFKYRQPSSFLFILNIITILFSVILSHSFPDRFVSKKLPQGIFLICWNFNSWAEALLLNYLINWNWLNKPK